jgi:hypothetical protein
VRYKCHEPNQLQPTTTTMPGILSLPSELLCEIIEAVSYLRQSQFRLPPSDCPQCTNRERCCLRATCKVLNELADPIVFRQLRLYLKRGSPHITEHQIIALAAQSSKACEFTRDLEIHQLPDGLRASEQSWPHFGYCDDLRVHLPTAISKLKNMTSFRLATSFFTLESVERY